LAVSVTVIYAMGHFAFFTQLVIPLGNSALQR
jgi:hypothetical protein